jgi:hypothetical protein
MPATIWCEGICRDRRMRFEQRIQPHAKYLAR